MMSTMLSGWSILSKAPSVPVFFAIGYDYVVGDEFDPRCEDPDVKLTYADGRIALMTCPRRRRPHASSMRLCFKASCS